MCCKIEQIPQKQNSKMIFVGHLEETDDLKKYGRNAPLADTEKNKEDLNKIVEAVVGKIRESNKKAILFVTSSRIRAIETANLIAAEIKKRLGVDIKIRYSSEDNLRLILSKVSLFYQRTTTQEHFLWD